MWRYIVETQFPVKEYSSVKSKAPVITSKFHLFNFTMLFVLILSLEKHYRINCSVDKSVPIFRQSLYRDHFSKFGLYFFNFVPIFQKIMFEGKICIFIWIECSAQARLFRKDWAQKSRLSAYPCLHRIPACWYAGCQIILTYPFEKNTYPIQNK